MMVSYFWVTRLRWTTSVSSFGEKTTRSPLTPGELVKRSKIMGTRILLELYDLACLNFRKSVPVGMNK